MSVRDRLRFGAQTAAFAVTSATLLSGLHAERALVAEVERHDLAHSWMRRWAKAILQLFRLEVQPSGLHIGLGNPYPAAAAGGSGRMFIFNHRSGMDIPVAYRLVDAHFVSRHDLAKWPLVGQAARSIGTLFVDRESRRSGAGVLREMVRTLRGGCAVGMFPEGTTFCGDEVRSLRAGAFTAAKQAGAEIVPIGLAYSDDAACFGDETFGAHMRRISRLRDLRVSVHAGEPFLSEGRDMSELRELGRERLQQAVDQARRNLR